MNNIVFIVGTGRSGTTFLAKLLDSHPDVMYRHEPDSVLVDTQIPFVPDEADLKRYCHRAQSYIEKLCKANDPKSNGHRPIFGKSYRTRSGQQIFRIAVYLAKIVEKTNIPVLSRRVTIPDLIDPNARTDLVYVIKTVDSLGRTRLFSEANPQSRFLHIVRHPCGVIASLLHGAEMGHMQKKAYLDSMYRLNESKKYPYSLEDMKRRSFEEQYAFGWMVLNQKVQDEMNQQSCYRMVRYEDICYQLQASAPDLFRFCSLEWSEQTEKFIAHLNASNRTKNGYFDIVRSPLSSIDRWRDVLTIEQVTRISNVIRHAPIGRQFLEP